MKHKIGQIVVTVSVILTLVACQTIKEAPPAPAPEPTSSASAYKDASPN